MAETSLSGPENLHTLVSVLWCILSKDNLFKDIFVQASVFQSMGLLKKHKGNSLVNGLTMLKLKLVQDLMPTLMIICRIT